jgi:hypothetical protein
VLVLTALKVIYSRPDNPWFTSHSCDLAKLNPVEFIRPYWKQHELLNSAPETTTNSVRRAGPYAACAAVRDAIAAFGQNDLNYAGVNRTRI